MSDDFNLPMRWSICSDDLPPFAAPWFKRSASVFGDLDSATFADDDPNALRAMGADAVGSALVEFAEEGLRSPRLTSRQVARLILDHFVEGKFLYDDLSSDIGLRRRDGKAQLSIIARRAERDVILAKLACLPRWGNLSADEAARAIRDQFERYEAIGWTRDRDLRTRPQGNTRGEFWSILQLGLGYPLPAIRDLVKLVGTARATARR